jgi:hypothetical protein
VVAGITGAGVLAGVILVMAMVAGIMGIMDIMDMLFQEDAEARCYTIIV